MSAFRLIATKPNRKPPNTEMELTLTDSDLSAVTRLDERIVALLGTGVKLMSVTLPRASAKKQKETAASLKKAVSTRLQECVFVHVSCG